MGTDFFPTGKTAREYHWLPSSSEVKNGWSYISAVAIHLHGVDTYKFYPAFTCRQWLMWHRNSIRTTGTCRWFEAVTIRLHTGAAICSLTAENSTEFHSRLVNVLGTSTIVRGASTQMQGLIFQQDYCTQVQYNFNVLESRCSWFPHCVKPILLRKFRPFVTDSDQSKLDHVAEQSSTPTILL